MKLLNTFYPISTIRIRKVLDSHKQNLRNRVDEISGSSVVD